jgi:hypothetical protein
MQDSGIARAPFHLLAFVALTLVLSVDCDSQTEGDLATIESNATSAPLTAQIQSKFFGMTSKKAGTNPLPQGSFGKPLPFAWEFIEQTKGVYDFRYYDSFALSAPRNSAGVAHFDITLAGGRSLGQWAATSRVAGYRVAGT